MDPVVTGSLISAGASLLGGLFGSSSQADANRQNAALQREFAQNGVRWKVEDAKKAGIHPLYALGAQTSMASPSYVGSSGEHFSQAGQHLGRAVSATRTAEEKAQAALQHRVLLAQALRDEAQAQYWLSEAARNKAPGTNPLPSSLDSSGVVTTPIHREQLQAHPLLDMVTVKPDEVTSFRKDSPNLTSGTHPGMKEYVIRSKDGKVTKAMLPISEEGPMEALESMPLYMYPAVIKDNIRRYGKNWLFEFLGWSDPGGGGNWAAPPTRRVKPSRISEGKITFRP